MTLRLRELARAIEARGEAPDVEVSGWSIDSRTLEPCDVFFALRGERHDGHEHLGEAFAKGAAAAVVDREVAAPGPLLRVGDSGQALAEAARWARRSRDLKVVGVTGSAGKTTTKDVIACLLSVAFAVGKNTGNLNNHFGLPLSILRLPDQARLAVLEMGMNHAGEIRHLASIAEPQVGVVTNVGFAHIEFFDSVDGIAAAKRELIESLPADGVAVLNADDWRVRDFRKAHRGHAILFGTVPEADLRAESIRWKEAGSRFEVEGVRFECPLPGEHGVLNVLAGLAVGRAFGIPLARMAPLVATLEAGPMRGGRRLYRGMVIYDDCYNANPEACRGMLEVLAREPARRRFAVLGEMRELGGFSEELHRVVGRHAALCGIDWVIGVAGDARALVNEARAAGVKRRQAKFFKSPEEAGEFLRGVAGEGDALLFKGSRGTAMERALERFVG